MEMNTTKDLLASLPISILNALTANPSTKPEVPAQRVEKEQNGFSEKLSAALEKMTPVEKTALPKEKPVLPEEASEDGKNDKDVAPAALPIGLAWLQAVIVTPAPAEQQAALSTTTGPGQNQPASVIPAIGAGQLQGGGAPILQAPAIAAPVTLAQGNVPLMDEINPAKSVPVPQAPAIAAPVTLVQGNVPLMDEINPAKTEPAPQVQGSVAPVILTQATPAPTEPKPIDGLPPRQIFADVSVMTGETVQQNVADPVATAVAPDAEVPMPDMKASLINAAGIAATIPKADTIQEAVIDPTIQKDIAAVSVTVAAQTVKPENKTDHAEEPQVSGVNAAEAAASKVQAATTAEKKSQQESLDTSEKESSPLVDEKSAAASAMPTTFEKTLQVVDKAAPLPSPTPERANMHEVARQVMDGMKTSTDRLQSSQVIITLKPEHLGEVTVKINVDGDKVTAAFHAASTEVRAILESSLPQLKQEMSKQGWNFDSNGVFGGMQEFLGNQQQQQQRADEMQRHAVTRNRGGYEGEGLVSEVGPRQVMSATSVDYRI